MALSRIWVSMICVALAFGAASLWGYFAGEQKKSENYDLMLRSAATDNSLYSSIVRVRPVKRPKSAI